MYSNRKIYDNWEKLVVAVVKRQQLWELFHQQSRSPSLLSEASDSSPGSSFRSSVHQQSRILSIRSEASDVTPSSNLGPFTRQRSPSICSEESNFSTSTSICSSIDDDVPVDFFSQLCSSRLEEAFADLEPKLDMQPKLVFVSDFSSSFDVDDVFLDTSELLGRGTFGNVYTASMENGMTIVVKRLKPGIISQVEFKRNMNIIRNFKHENVVPLRAYYFSKDEKLLLYDHYSQGSVYSLLHGQKDEKHAHVDWETRLRIAIGAALGIREIHAQDGGKFVHGNIKASNVFINSKQYGCISDLGLANMVTTPFLPTAWCYAPEIENNTQNISQESDVYSYGILILELLTRKSPINIPGGPEALDLVKLVTSVKSKDWAVKVFDADLLKNPQIKDDMIKMLQIGRKCVAESPKQRPSMSSVVNMLEDIRVRVAGPPIIGKLTFVGNNNPSFDTVDLSRAATSLLGEGSFGISFKDTLENGNTMRLKSMWKDVKVSLEEFQAQAKVLGRMRHENVCELRAYYLLGNERILVYDYNNQGSLSILLHGKLADGGQPLDWTSRLKIAIGAARGLAHIHGQDGGTFVHGNVKTGNIFRNKQQFGLISDAGHTKFTRPTRISPTPSYIAPEITRSSRVSQASDVYSFGVVLLELVSGKPSEHTTSDGEHVSLVKWFKSFTHEEWTAEVLDIELVKNAENDLEAMKQLLQIGLKCVASAPEHRPKMSQVVWMLDEISGGIYHVEQPSVESRLEYLLEDLLTTVVPDRKTGPEPVQKVRTGPKPLFRIHFSYEIRF